MGQTRVSFTIIFHNQQQNTNSSFIRESFESLLFAIATQKCDEKFCRWHSKYIFSFFSHQSPWWMWMFYLDSLQIDWIHNSSLKEFHCGEVSFKKTLQLQIRRFSFMWFLIWVFFCGFMSQDFICVDCFS